MNQKFRVILVLLPFVSGDRGCRRYGTCPEYDYLPAPPGRTPDCARRGSTFCENVDGYPRHRIWYLAEKGIYDFATLLANESPSDVTVDHRFARIIDPYPDRRYRINPRVFGGSFDHGPGTYGTREGSLNSFSYRGSGNGTWHRAKRQEIRAGTVATCATRANYIMPKAALNTRGNWMYTVNVDELDGRYTQLVRSETCTSDTCSGLCALPNGYSSRCRQQYVQKRLIALEGNGERLYSDLFWFPHCCTCQILRS